MLVIDGPRLISEDVPCMRRSVVAVVCADLDGVVEGVDLGSRDEVVCTGVLDPATESVVLDTLDLATECIVLNSAVLILLCVVDELLTVVARTAVLLDIEENDVVLVDVAADDEISSGIVVVYTPSMMGSSMAASIVSLRKR